MSKFPIFQVRMFTPETVNGVVLDSSLNQYSSTSSIGGSVIIDPIPSTPAPPSDKFVKVSKNASREEEEEEEEEEDEEVLIPTLNKNRLQILRTDDRWEKNF